MTKLLKTKSYDIEVPMSVQCNIISLIGRLQDIITFVILKCKQMKTLKKTARFQVSNLH